MKSCLIILAFWLIVAIGGFYIISSLGMNPDGYGKDQYGEYTYQDSCVTTKLDTIHRFTGKFWIHRQVEICDSSVVIKRYLK